MSNYSFRFILRFESHLSELFRFVLGYRLNRFDLATNQFTKSFICPSLLFSINCTSKKQFTVCLFKLKFVSFLRHSQGVFGLLTQNFLTFTGLGVKLFVRSYSIHIFYFFASGIRIVYIRKHLFTKEPMFFLQLLLFLQSNSTLAVNLINSFLLNSF